MTDDTLYAYVVQNDRIGREQIMHAAAGAVIVPLYAWTLEELEQNRIYAEAHAKKFNVPVKIAMFSGRRDLETIQPPVPLERVRPPAVKPNRAKRRATKKATRKGKK